MRPAKQVSVSEEKTWSHFGHRSGPHRRGTADGHQTAVEARQAVRAMVRNEDQRAQALRDIGAEVGSAICSISTQRIR